MEAITKDGHIEIDGVVLTEKLVKYLKWMQDKDHIKTDYIRSSIAEASCFIGRMFTFMDLEDEAIELIRKLGMMHGEFKNFLPLEN